MTVGPRHAFWNVLGPAEAPRFGSRRKDADGARSSVRSDASRCEGDEVLRSTTADIIGILGEVNRLAARCQMVFGRLRQETGLTGIEVLTLIAVAHADTAPTVPQVGRSLGHPRQVIQRAVRVLEQRGLVSSLPNPGHKRASLLVATEAGRELGRWIDGGADAVATRLGQGLDAGLMADTFRGLLALRARIDAESGELAEADASGDIPPMPAQAERAGRGRR